MSLAVRLFSATLVLALLSACSNGPGSGNATAVVPAVARTAPDIAFHPGNQRRIGTGWVAPVGVAVDPATHDVYVAESFAGTIKKIASDGKITVLAKGLRSPYGIAFDTKTNDVYVAERGTQQIVAVAADGSVTKIASGFKAPIGVSVDPMTGIAYVADNLDNSIYEVARDGKVTRIATVQNPSGVAFDTSSRELYIASQTKVFRLKPDGQLISVGEGWTSPFGIAVDPSTHYVYVADRGAGAVKEIGPAGTIASISFSIVPWGVAVDKETHHIYATENFGDAVWRIDASGQQAIRVSYPERLAYSQVTQELYVVERADRAIARVDADGTVDIIEHVRDGNPNDVGVDTDSGDVYFTETSGNPPDRASEFKKIAPDGTVSTIYRDTDVLYDIAVNSRDHVVYVDVFNSRLEHKILEFKNDKLVATIAAPGEVQSLAYDSRANVLYASTKNAVFRIKDGSGTSVGKGWTDPRAIAVDSSTGNAYVVDGPFTDSVIKKLTPDGTVTTIASGLGVCMGVTLDERSRDLYASDFYAPAVIKFVRALNL